MDSRTPVQGSTEPGVGGLGLRVQTGLAIAVKTASFYEYCVAVELVRGLLSSKGGASSCKYCQCRNTVRGVIRRMGGENESTLWKAWEYQGGLCREGFRKIPSREKSSM